MKYVDLLKKVSDLPVFTASFLSAGGNLAQIRLQLSRWVKDGKIVRLHKGFYTLADPYRKVTPEPFCIANSLKKASYVSLHSALSWYGLVPEFVPVITNITTSRPQMIETPLGRFEFRHVSKKYFWGYHRIDLKFGQTAFIALPEKALLDIIYLTPGGNEIEFIEELRLQNYEQINREVLREFVKRFKSPKLKLALENIEKILEESEGIEL